MIMAMWWCTACTDSDDVGGAVESLLAEYELPQGKSDADDRIVKCFEDYGSYILYEYSSVDIDYEFTWFSFAWAEPDPTYVGDMMDLLEDIWFDFYPAEFHRKFMPLKIFLSESVGLESWDGSMIYQFSILNESSLIVGFCSDTLQKLSSTTKKEFMKNLQINLWTTWVNSVELPDEFFALSDYSYPATADDPSSSDYVRNRGFISDYTYGYADEWSTYGHWETGVLDELTDASTYITNMIRFTSAEWAADLEWPLVKQKYDILRNWFIEQYGFDLQGIGDMTYE